MERIAIISDIHGNIPALEAVLADIQSRGITRIFCLGDLVGKGPHPEKAVDMIKECCEVVVKGNWDDFVSKQSDDRYVHWHQKRLGEERLEYLATLPFSTEFYMSGNYIRLFHASAESVYVRVQPWDPLEQRLEMFSAFNEKQPDIVGYGDIHNAYVQHINGKVLFNVGSVGNPLDLPQAAYGIVEGEFGSTSAAPFAIQIIRVPYDIERSVAQAIAEDMPSLEAYIEELRTAVYRGRKQ